MTLNISDIKAIKMKNILLIIFGLSLFLLASCDYFENSDTLDSSSIEFSVSGLPAIPDTMTFVAWFENEDTSQSQPTIIFSGDATNGAINYRAEKPLRTIQTAQLFWITVERKSVVNSSSPPTAPANSRKILGGRFANAGCNLGLGEKVFDFESASAVYNLLTPTDTLDTNELSGIWFVDSLDQGAAPGLNLPELFGGWRYEGWVEVNGVFISTGRFSLPRGVDQRNFFGGNKAPLPFPGEDFLSDPSSPPIGINFPIDLSGVKVYISLEVNDNSNAGTSPGLIIYESTVPNPAQSRVAYNMAGTGTSLPVGNAFIKVDLVE